MIDYKTAKNFTQNLTVLLVEDDEVTLSLFKGLLSKLFDQVHSAKNGQEALEVYQQYGDMIHLVITDIQMPIMDGLEMSRCIRAFDPDIHIMISTAYDELGYATQAIDIGVDGFLIKPVDEHKLCQSLYKVSKRIKAEQELASYQEKLEETIKDKARELIQITQKDGLTGLGTRSKLFDDIKQTQKSHLAILDIQAFSHINHFFGYSFGDYVIVESANRLHETLPNSAYTLYHLYGDLFALHANANKENLYQTQYQTRQIP